ncbi:hypothetical protein [Rummeliibacillus pycnus]|uniref:hypothetical protein n=1 Tax=Rummeliibacillus pycnus TaxID=101070 RepID=UPI001B803342|nr:hypothetical protein [Rummeliibacillus pycnus]
MALLLIFIPSKNSIIEVFRLTDEPNVITKGTYGMSLTIDLSYADAQFIEWLNEIKTPYPLLMVDTDLLKRSPTLVKVIQSKNIPIGLLGKSSDFYEMNPSQLEKDISTFSTIMKQPPLWFRTKDYIFLPGVTKVLWKEQINMLAASKIQTSQDDLKLSKGDIVSIPYHQEERLQLKQIDRLIERNSFQSIEQTIFGYSIKTKKSPE